MATVEAQEIKEEIRLDQKVKVRSIAPWNTGSARKTTNGDVSIPATPTP